LTKSSGYIRRKQHYQWYLAKLDRVLNRFVRLKLMVLLTGLGAASYFMVLRKYPIGGSLVFLGILFLIYLDIGHRKVILRREYVTVLKDLNDQSLGRLNGRWVDFGDTGSEFWDDAHPYAADLDIFGQGSLFQWINVTRTYLGRKKLSRLLTVAPDSLTAIRERQAAIGELAKNLNWRQQLQAWGTVTTDVMRDPDFLLQWVNERNPFMLRNWVAMGLRILPVLTLGMLIIACNTKVIPLYLPVLMLLLQYGLLRINGKNRAIVLMKAGAYERNLQIYGDLIRHILKRNFKSPYLQNLKRKLFNRGRKSASQQLQKLTKIIDAISNRYNGFYAIINLITLWDYQCLIALEKWKVTSGMALRDWLDTIAEFEALASLAIIRYDHPDWAIPEVITGAPAVTATQLGHPLLAEAVRVTNPLALGDQTKVLLITGSNMSGKSTYLRTAGINLVLAYAGAPVCAAAFRCALCDIYTCMRIGDNLEKNLSSFYAEILRIKAIVAAASDSRPLFFLLDEIFKGTNSLDRHTGAKMLIKKLLRNNTIGLVSTHDLELGELAQEVGTVANYHFREYFNNNQLSFDYQMHPGISTTRNARYLMKIAGIVDDLEGRI
jgi:hypothetical protein